jgi:hypothetical protein
VASVTHAHTHTHTHTHTQTQLDIRSLIRRFTYYLGVSKDQTSVLIMANINHTILGVNPVRILKGQKVNWPLKAYIARGISQQLRNEAWHGVVSA